MSGEGSQYAYKEETIMETIENEIEIEKKKV